MKKRLVYQLSIPGNFPTTDTFHYIKEMYDFSEEQARNYAKRCNADYYVITKTNDWIPGVGKHLAYQKLKVYDFHDYDQIVYFDSDYIIKNDSPNIFDLLGDKFSAVADPGNCKKLAKTIGIPQRKYINTGFMYFTKEILDRSREAVIDKYIKVDTWKFKDQCLWSRAFYDLKLDFNPLDPLEWNPSHVVFGKYADHYSGIHKNKWNKKRYE